MDLTSINIIVAAMMTIKRRSEQLCSERKKAPDLFGKGRRVAGSALRHRQHIGTLASEAVEIVSPPLGHLVALGYKVTGD